MSLKPLIHNQSLIIDDHKWGAKEEKNWDKSSTDVHIDKKTKYPIGGKKQDVRILIPINSKIQNILNKRDGIFPPAVHQNIINKLIKSIAKKA